MTTKEFSIDIYATPEKVWFALWDDFHYRTWTSAFCEGSYAVSDWSEGSKIHFLSPSGDGMNSLISKNVPFEKMYFTHLGNIKNFAEQPIDEETKHWSGARENYDLIDNKTHTTLKATIDLTEEHLNFFNESFPVALKKVKEQAENLTITIKAEIAASPEKVWNYFTKPEHIVNWCFASPDWHCPKAENDLKTGGKFNSKMEAKDGSYGFDFEGIYTLVKDLEVIEYKLTDDRKVKILFKSVNNSVLLMQTFDPENENSLELQKNGWQSILDNFKNYVEKE